MGIGFTTGTTAINRESRKSLRDGALGDLSENHALPVVPVVN